MLVKGPRYNIIHSHWCNHNVTLVLMTQPRWISVDEFYMDLSKQENLPQKSIAFHNTENVKEWIVLQCFRMFRLKHITHENSICVWFICSQEPLLPRKAIGCKRYISSNPICGFARCATGISKIDVSIAWLWWPSKARYLNSNISKQFESKNKI